MLFIWLSFNMEDILAMHSPLPSWLLNRGYEITKNYWVSFRKATSKNWLSVAISDFRKTLRKPWVSFGFPRLRFLLQGFPSEILVRKIAFHQYFWVSRKASNSARCQVQKQNKTGGFQQNAYHTGFKKMRCICLLPCLIKPVIGWSSRWHIQVINTEMIYHNQLRQSLIPSISLDCSWSCSMLQWNTLCISVTSFMHFLPIEQLSSSSLFSRGLVR